MPGTVWELRRAGHEPSVKESSLIEAARIMLVSLTALLPAALILVAGAWAFAAYQEGDAARGFAVVRAWTTRPWSGYALSLSASIIGCLGALIVARLRWRGESSHFSHGDTWYQGMVRLAPTIPYLTVELDDATVWRGSFLGFDSAPATDRRNLALRTPISRRKPDANSFTNRPTTQVVLLPENQIRSIQVHYPEPEPEPGRGT